jgi:hypothetical protein
MTFISNTKKLMLMAALVGTSGVAYGMNLYTNTCPVMNQNTNINTVINQQHTNNNSSSLFNNLLISSCSILGLSTTSLSAYLAKEYPVETGIVFVTAGTVYTGYKLLQCCLNRQRTAHHYPVIQNPVIHNPAPVIHPAPALRRVSGPRRH